MMDFGIAQPIIDNINDAGIETVCFDGVLPDPPDEMVEEAAEIARSSKCDVIVAIGGGSSMDTAKGVNVLINNPPPIRQYFGVQKNLRPGLPMAFIPTTAGTGSETTNMCVISCVSLNKKDSVVSPVCVGEMAFLDAELTLGLPSVPTAQTGIDAFAHVVESITGAQANPLSDALCRDAIRTIKKWLPVAVADGKNIVAREKMMEASFFAGMAFTNALVHLGHSIGHTIGARFHVPHGQACAFCLPEVIEYTARTEKEKVIMICEAMGVNVPKMNLLANMMAGLYGGPIDITRVTLGLGVKTLLTERAFNKLAGFTAEDDKLPEFFYTERSNATGSKFDINPVEMEVLFDF